MHLFKRHRRQNADTPSPSKDPKARPPGTPLTPLPPYRAHLRNKTFSEVSLLSPSLTCASVHSDQTHAPSKSELLGHALHLARLAVILDRAEIYTGAARAYYDCCFLLASVEPLLARIEADITNKIKRLAFLSALAPISAGHTLQFPLDISPTPEYYIDLTAKSIQPMQLIELNRLCQFLCTLSHCTQIIQNLASEKRAVKSKGTDDEGLLVLSSEFERLREDIIRFRGYYSKEELVNGSASNILFVLLGSFRRKIGNLVKSGNKQLVLFLLSLFDIQLPDEYGVKIKPLPPQPLNIPKPSEHARIQSSGRPQVAPGSTENSAAVFEGVREQSRMAPVPMIPRKSSKRQKNRGEARKRPSYVPDTDYSEEQLNKLTSGGTFYLN
ncbi:hypothetical protein ABW21_db0209028 [Orbilia brochopaga]|nr:hypothetical protein ABW21_db0209028 [Drechslerella brochopaga]